MPGHADSALRTFDRVWAEPCHLGDPPSRLPHLSGSSGARPHARRPAAAGSARSCRRRARPRGRRAPGASAPPASYAGRWWPDAGRARAGGAAAGTRGRPVREASASFVRRTVGRRGGALGLRSRRAEDADDPACASAARPPRSRCPFPKRVTSPGAQACRSCAGPTRSSLGSERGPRRRPALSASAGPPPHSFPPGLDPPQPRPPPWPCHHSPPTAALATPLPVACP